MQRGIHEQNIEGAYPSTEVHAPKTKNRKHPGRGAFGQVEPVNYSNAALEQRRRGTMPQRVGGKVPYNRIKSIRYSCDIEAAHPRYLLCLSLAFGVITVVCL